MADDLEALEAPVLRIGLCGLGDAGQLHARALLAAQPEDDFAWTAIAGRDAAGIERFRRRIAAPLPGELREYLSLEDLLRDEVCDAVILATPDGLHVAQTLRCLIAGVHVLVEKPLALNAAEARAVVDTATAAGLVVQAGYHLRHHAGHRLMRERMDELCGRVHHVSASWAWPDPAVTGWRARGEAAKTWSLAALGTHCLDLITWLTGATTATTATTIDRVAAVLEPPQGADVSAVVAMTLSNGATAQMACAVTHRAPSRVVIAGERGELEALGTLGAHGAGELRYRPVVPRGQVDELSFSVENPYLAQLREFTERVAVGRHPGDEDASLVANVSILDRICDASRRSADE